MKRILTGLQPSGTLHVGNYFGAIRPMVELQEQGEMFLFLADLHALTSTQDAAALRTYVREAAIDLLACGIDPARTLFWRQSDVPLHAELMWILSTVTPMGLMERMVAYKEKVQKGIPAGVGLFTYPILQAADILLYRPQYVPVGEDQRQHLELTRDLAGRFNHRYKKTFRLPEPYILKETAKITDLQEPTAKMSKSSSSPGGIIELLDDPSVNAKKIRSAVTDSGTEIRFDPDQKPGVSNLLTIYSALTDRAVGDLEQEYDGRGYGALKQDLADVVVEFVTPFRDRTLELLEDQQALMDILEAGRVEASAIAETTLRDVFQRVGFAAARPTGL